MRKFNSILQHFLSVVLILNGVLLAINWFKNANPNKDEFILWIAAANLAVGGLVYVSGFIQRRKALKKLQADPFEKEGS